MSLTATTLGRMSEPLSLGTTRATLLHTYATQVLVVPRSIPSRMGLSAAMSEPDATAQRVPEARKGPFQENSTAQHREDWVYRQLTR